MKYSRIVVIVMVLLTLLLVIGGGVPIVLVFDGGPKSHGDELIVRTSRFFAEPARKERKRMKNESEK
jgi:hypothetical protein